MTAVERGWRWHWPQRVSLSSASVLAVRGGGWPARLLEPRDQAWTRLFAIRSSMDQRVGAAGGRQSLILGIIVAVRQQYDRNFAQPLVFADGSAELEAVDARHQNVGDHGIGQGRLGFHQRFRAVFRRRYAETKIGEIGGQQL